jgi:hypothetical protein
MDFNDRDAHVLAKTLELNKTLSTIDLAGLFPSKCVWRE